MPQMDDYVCAEKRWIIRHGDIVKRAILTVNFNAALCDNSRASMIAAAERWNAGFTEIHPGFFTNGDKPAVSPASLKCFCFSFCDEDEFFILDADVIVGAECPNPFDTFTGSELIAVQNGSGRFGDLSAIRSCEQFEWNKLLAQDSRFRSVPYRPGEYFNTGMMLVRREHHAEAFRLIEEVVSVDHGLGWNDQTPINVCVKYSGVAVKLVDERWNYIHPYMLGGGWETMRSAGGWIYHGAGEPSRILWLPKVNWR